MRGGFGSRLRNDNQEEIKLREIDKDTIKLLFKYLKPNSKRLSLAFLAMVVVTASSLAGPYLIKLAVDDYILQKDFRGLNIILLLMMITYGIFWASSFFQTYLSSYVGEKIVATIREDLYKHIQKMSIDFYKKRLTGDIMARLTHDVNSLSELVSSGFVHFFNDVLTLLGIMVIMILLNLKLALISFSLIPIIFFAIFLLGKKMRYAYRDVREKLAKLNADVEENLSGIRLIQAVNREAVNNKNFKKLSWENLKANLKAVSYFALLFPAMNISKVLGEALILIFGGYAVINGHITLGILLAFMEYVRRFFSPLADMSQIYNTYQSAAAGLDRINEYLKIEPTVKESKNPKRIGKNIRGKIEFKDVSFAYEKELILKNIYLSINENESFAIVGPTGAGKTTFVNLLTRLYDTKKGSIAIDGVNIKEIDFKSLRNIISVVPQNVYLFDTTIKENIRYGKPTASDKEIEEAALKVKAHDFIEKLPDGYETKVGEGGSRLSGGQKQLISFARALISNPKILILDEATSSVDAYTEVLIQEALDILLEGRTAVMIAHRFTTLKKASRIAVLKNGEICGLGNHQNLMENNELYKNLYLKQKQ
ncbi:MAG: ABC transporter ATP-binding protein [Eubacteriales bacterium]